MAETKQDDETILEEAKNLLVQGKRFMALEDYQSATDSLEQSCQLFDAFYGVAKRPCADAYFEYGLALVALANLEAGSGTDKIMKKAGIEEEEEDEGEEEEEEEEEGEDDEGGQREEEEDNRQEKDGETSKTNQSEENKTNGKDTGSESAVPMEEGEQEISATNNIDSIAQNGKVNGELKTNGHANNLDQPPPQGFALGSDPMPGTSSGVGGDAIGDEDRDNEDVENEEATTIEVAWEVLCLAKRLFMEDESLEGRMKLAETLQKIGEISIEWDNNDNAVSILEECLKIRQAILEPDDRLIALTYYNLGLAHSFKSDTQNANDNFQKAIHVIERRVASLSENMEKAKANQDTVTISSYQKEINELKELLPDMTMRLDDSKEDSIKSTEVLKRTREEMQQEDEAAKKVCSDKTKPVDDISHLVKRKSN